MKNQIIGDNSKKINEFLKIYEELFNTLEYDDEYAQMCELEDGVDDLSAYQIKQKNIERTQKYKQGDSKMFAMRLNHELTSLGIENYLMKVQEYKSPRWANLYKDNEEWKVANITEDIIQKNNAEQSKEKDTTLYSSVPAEEFLVYNENCSTLEAIQDNGKKIEDLKETRFTFYNIEQDKINQEEELGLVVKQENIFETIKNWFKQTIEYLGWEDLFKPVGQPKYLENQDNIKEELLAENNRTDFVPKAKVNEEMAIKRAEEKAQESKIEEKSKEQ